MNTVEEKREKSMLEQLREIRDKVSAETQYMTFSELKKYVESHIQESLFPKTVWAYYVERKTKCQQITSGLPQRQGTCGLER